MTFKESQGFGWFFFIEKAVGKLTLVPRSLGDLPDETKTVASKKLLKLTCPMGKGLSKSFSKQIIN